MSKKASALNLALISRTLSDEDAAREYFEKLRWPEGAACPHGGGAEVYRLTAKAESVKPGRKGLLKCKTAGGNSPSRWERSSKPRISSSRPG